MALGLQEKKESYITFEMCRCSGKPWKIPSRSNRFMKKAKHRRERQRVRINPEAPTEYGKYSGWEW